MNRTFTYFVCILMCAVLVFSFAACETDGEQTDSLVVYNWADYIYDYEEDFKEYYHSVTGKNIEITYVTFDTNETMLTKIMKGDSSVDVVCPSEYAIQKLMESDFLVPLNYFDEEKYTSGYNWSDDYVHNSGNVDSHIVEKISDAFGGEMLDYMVPYMYGTLGILYNKSAFEELGIYDKDILNKANWGILFNDDGDGNLLSEGLTGSILMKDSIRDSYAATVFYLLESGKLNVLTYSDGTAFADMSAGDLINAVDDQLIELCKEALTNQKSQLFGYEVDFGKDDLLKGNAIVDLAWSGDAMYAVEESDGELAYYVPNTTGNIWFDGWVVPKTYNPDHEEAIKLFINFLNSPYVAAANMMEIGYSSAVSPDVVRNDAEARSVLCDGESGYNVYDACRTDIEVKTRADFATESEFEEYLSEFDYASWEEFAEYFFDSVNEIDDSNWRYPFVSAETNTSNRSLATLGIMRDYGENNNKVVTMWNFARSAGVSVWGALGWTALVLAVLAGIVALSVFVARRKRRRVVISKN